MVTVTVRTTLMKKTVKRWCVNSPTMYVPTTPPSACLQRKSATALRTAQMALMRTSAVRKEQRSGWKQNSKYDRVCFQTVMASFLHFADLCSVNNGGCSHNCTVAPGEGLICSCPLGMEVGSDNKTCQIQSFCAKHLKCSQRCEQDKFSVKCSCYEGWELESDLENCKSTGEREPVKQKTMIRRPRQGDVINS